MDYQVAHSLALILVSVLAMYSNGASEAAEASNRQTLLRLSGWAFCLGILLFSGSLYALALTGLTMLGAITPLGGLCFLAGWAALVAFSLQKTHRA